MEDKISRSVNQSESLSRKFIQKLRDIMLVHDWPKVLKIVDCLVKIPAAANWIVYRVSELDLSVLSRCVCIGTKDNYISKCPAVLK